jgi:hypothetical protein
VLPERTLTPIEYAKQRLAEKRRADIQEGLTSGKLVQDKNGGIIPSSIVIANENANQRAIAAQQHNETLRALAALKNSGTMDNPDNAALADGLVNYEISLADLGRMPQGAKAHVYAMAKEQAKAEGKEWDASKYRSRLALRTDFTTGKTAQNIDALNTAVDHISNLQEAAKALNNGNVQLFNKLSNDWTTATGKPAVTNFSSLATAVESEVASLLKKAGATDQEINAWRANISPNMSPEQLSGVMKELGRIMHGREKALQSRWKTGMGDTKDYPIFGEYQMPMYQSLIGQGQGPSTSTTGAAPETKVVNGVTYRKVQGGWEAQ